MPLLGLLFVWLWLVLMLGGLLPFFFGGTGPAVCGAPERRLLK
ncbi:MAG: hypothetical protein Q8N23_32515 [Archangium sp.]|nr:hypothetical protein [Archangium sp.]